MCDHVAGHLALPARWRIINVLFLATLCTAAWVGSVHAAISAATVAPASLVAGVTGDASIAFTTGLGVPVGGRITVVFPSTFFIESPALATTPAAVGVAGGSLAMGANTHTIVLTIVGTAVDPGTSISFTISGVTNPGDGTTAKYTIRTADTTANTIESTSNVAGSDIAKSGLTDATLVPTTTDAGALNQFTVAFTTDVMLRVGSQIELQFPVSTFVTAGAIATNHVNLHASSAVTSTTMPSLRLTIASQTIPAATGISVTFDRIYNPAEQLLGAFTIRTRHATGSILQDATDSTIAAILSTTLSSTASVKPVSYFAGVTTTFLVNFPNAAYLLTGAKIKLTFPAQFVISGVTLAGVSSLPFTGTFVSLTATTATLTLGGALFPGVNRGFSLAGVINPGSRCDQYIYEYCATAYTDFSIVLTDASDNTFEQSTTVPGTPILKKPMKFARIRPILKQPNVLTSATLSFTSEVTIPIGGKIDVIFPSGYIVGAGAVASGHVLIPVASSAVTVTGQQVSLAVAGANVPPAAQLGVTFSAITTPESSATGMYIVRTRDANGKILEEHEQVNGEGCPYLNGCNGHGTCTLFSRTCMCDEGWGAETDVALYRSPDCTLRTCPSGTSWNNLPNDATTSHNILEECSAMGTCDRSTGKCSCFSGFTGSACQRMTCPNNCGGRGKCVSMRELATMKTAMPLSLPTTYSGAANFATWDEDRVFGCACDSSWAVGTGANEIQVTEYFGGDCSRRHCPTGNDPETVADETDCSASGTAGNLCHVECSNRGICNYRNGQCQCFAGFSGFACQKADVFSK